MNRLEGKVALITGGARGLGEATSRQFVEQGARIVIGDVLTEDGEALAAELGDNAAFVQMDVGEQADWNRAIARATRVRATQRTRQQCGNRPHGRHPRYQRR